MKAALSVKVLRLSIITGLWLGLAACGSKNSTSESNAALPPNPCSKVGSSGTIQDGNTIFTCVNIDGVQTHEVLNQGVQGGNHIFSTQAGPNGEFVGATDVWADQNVGAVEGAVSAPTCVGPAAKSDVQDSEGRNWNTNSKGESCIRL